MNKITQEMLDELNTEYGDAVFEFKFNTTQPTVVDIKLKSQYHKYINSYIINIESDVLEQIRCWFLKNNIKIRYNNTASCFWASV